MDGDLYEGHSESFSWGLDSVRKEKKKMEERDQQRDAHVKQLRERVLERERELQVSERALHMVERENASDAAGLCQLEAQQEELT